MNHSARLGTATASRAATFAAPFLVFAGVTGGEAWAQPPDPGEYSRAEYEVDVTRGVLVPMRDGVRLSVDIYAPQGSAGPFPGILAHTPYDNNGQRETATWFAERGYVVVSADARGRYDSEGEWDPFGALHRVDGYDLVEWVAAQPWCTGKVGMIGGSYLGWTQWWAASMAPPHLAAIAPRVSPPDPFENLPYQHGVLLGGWMLDWAAGSSGRTAQLADTGYYSGWPLHRQDPPHTPYIEINAARGLRSAPWFETWYRQNRTTDPYWSAIRYQTPESYSRITVPSLAFTGWFDGNHPGSPMNYVGMKQYGATPEARRPTLVIGPWTHGINTRSLGGIDYGPDAVIDIDGYVMRWFDHFLKGIDNGVVDDPPVYIFVMGENRWYAEDDWPLSQTEWTSYYLTSEFGANSLRGDGLLTTTPPTTEGHDTYVYDPLTPTRTPFDSWPNTNGHIDGALDTRVSASGDEVLVYRTPPLEEAVEVTGPIEARLYASTSARDTDWFVRLVDVHPDGYSALLTEGVMRARNRDPDDEGRFNGAQLSTIEPDEVYEYTIRFWRGTGNLFKEGHRIGIEISSSWYSYYLPNLNTGADNVAMVTRDEAVVATQRIFHGGERASNIVLPVIRRQR